MYNMFRGYKSPTGNFKSPMLERSKAVAVNPESVQKEIDKLQEKCNTLDIEIKELEDEGCKEEELESHIDKLHEYNEIKDVGQMVLGRIATLKGVRSQDLYEKYGLNLTD